MYSSYFDRSDFGEPIGVGTRRSAMAPDCGVHVEQLQCTWKNIGASVDELLDFLAAIIDGPDWTSRWRSSGADAGAGNPCYETDKASQQGTGQMAQPTSLLRLIGSENLTRPKRAPRRLGPFGNQLEFAALPLLRTSGSRESRL